MTPRPILTALLFCCTVWGLALWFFMSIEW